MSEMWGDAADANSDWSLPGDAEIEARMRGDEPAPEPEPEQQTLEPVAETEPEVAEEAEQPEESEAARERDEQGRFVAKQPEEQTPEEKLAEKYKTDEDLRKAHLELQRLYGEQTRELGQFRQTFEQWTAQQQPQQAQPVGPQPDWQELLDEDPATAADIARANNNQYAYQQAIQAMADSYGRGFVKMYERTAEAEWAAYQAQQAQVPIQAQAQQNELAQSIQQFHVDNAWFRELSNDDIVAAAQENPSLITKLEMNDPATYTDALLALGLQAVKMQHARGRQNGDTLTTAAADIAKAQAQAAIEAKQEAVLASATANTDGGPKLTPEERLREQIGAEWEASRNKLDAGWNV